MTTTPDESTPRGWRYAGVRAGIKTAGDDTAILVSDRPCASAARVTTNLAFAPCVGRARRRLPNRDVRGLVVVAGCANALAGAASDEADVALADAAADALSVPRGTILTATTGVVGVPLEIGPVRAALPRAAQALDASPASAAQAILTTDTRAKLASATVDVDGVEARLLAFGKGAGMIHPNMATMLCFVTSDLSLTAGAADAVLGPAVKRSFNRISVDGDTSCNDMVVLMANGASGARQLDLGDPLLSAVKAALTQLLQDIARQIAADGEGANRLVSVRVSGAATEAEADAAARGVARSNLVKAAIFGRDPNWGRIVVAAGQALAEHGSKADPMRWRLSVQGTQLFATGEPVPFDKAQLSQSLGGDEVEITLDLGDGPDYATAFGCDLSYDYVRVNAEYHT